MAKPHNTSSTIAWIWLREALKVAVLAVGSDSLAKRLLLEWMWTEKLPWSCVLWEGRNADFMTFLEQVNSSLGKVRLRVASTRYHEGDPEFWRAPGLMIDWEENEAHDSALGGAKASGIRVSHTHFHALLPERKQVHGAGPWAADEVRRMMAANELRPGIRITELAQKLERRMQKAAAANKSIRPITWRSIKNMLPQWGLWPITRIK